MSGDLVKSENVVVPQANMEVVDELVTLHQEKGAFHAQLDKQVDCGVDQADIGPHELPCFVLVSVILLAIWVCSVKVFVIDL